MNCKHERLEEMRGIIFCMSCGEEIGRFFGLFKMINKKCQSIESKIFIGIDTYKYYHRNCHVFVLTILNQLWIFLK